MVCVSMVVRNYLRVKMRTIRSVVKKETIIYNIYVYIYIYIYIYIYNKIKIIEKTEMLEIITDTMQRNVIHRMSMGLLSNRFMQYIRWCSKESLNFLARGSLLRISHSRVSEAIECRRIAISRSESSVERPM